MGADLTKGSIYSKLLHFVAPLLAGSLLQVAYYFVDALIVGRYVGKEALGAIDAVFHLVWMPLAVFLGFAAGASVLISQYFGAKKESEQKNMIDSSVAISYVVGAVLSLCGVAASKYVLRLSNIPEDIFDLAHTYIIVCYAGLVFEVIYNMNSSVLRALGNSRTPFAALAVGCVVNICLDIAFVIFLDMGIFGAALATFIALGVSAFIVAVAVGRAYRPKFRLHRSSISEMLSKGLPIALQTAFFPISNIIIRSYLNLTGTESISAMALTGSLDAFVWVYIDSVTVAVSTFVAQNYGAGEPERARKGLKAGMVLMGAVVVSFSTLLVIFAVPLGKIFLGPEDYGVLPLMAELVRIQAPFYVVFGIAELIGGAIKGTGDTLRPMLITLVFTVGARLVWVWFFIGENPIIHRIILCYPISWALTAAVFAADYAHRRSTIYGRVKHR